MEYRKIPHPRWVTVVFWTAFLVLSVLTGLFFGLAMQGH